jgi:hypothetical protein
MRKYRTARRISDQQLVTMLAAFAGPEQPVLTGARPSEHRRRFGLSRRGVVVIGAGIVALAATVPAVALLGAFSETPKQFLADTNEPVNAKQMIKSLLSPAQQDEPAYQLASVQRVVSAQTPQGEVRLYAFQFSNGYRGSAMMSVATDRVSGAVWGPPASCPSGWALRAGGSFVQYPGRTPLFFSGQASDAVGSVDIVYPDRHQTSAVLSNGYFLGWVVPKTGNDATRASFSPPVDLVARDRTGNEIGRLRLRSDGDIPPAPGQPAQAIACG